VRRDGEEHEISAEELVPGDVVILAPGDRISADAEIVSRHELRVDNSTLTGESRPVAPDRLVYAGTHVARGRGEAVVAATGMATEFGKIAELTQRAEEKPSPLELELRRVTRLVAAVSFGLGSLFFVVAGFLGMGLGRFVFAIGVTVANVPEGLPTVTLSLALGTQRMAKRNAGPPALLGRDAGRDDRHLYGQDGHVDRERDDRGARLVAEHGWFEVEGAGYEPFGRFHRNGRVADRARCTAPRCALLRNDAR
jgi:P-type E1-E2 ATPase